MKRYEGLFILDLTGKEEGVNDAVDKVKSIITDCGAKVETVQKMDKKPFARVTDKDFSSGYYVNFIFEIAPPRSLACVISFAWWTKSIAFPSSTRRLLLPRTEAGRAAKRP